MTRFTPQWLQAGSYAASIDRRLIGALWPTAATSGMAVTVSAAMTLNIAAGQCAVPTANNTGSALCSSDAVEQVTLTAAPASGSNRIDLVCCQVRATDIDGGTDNDFIFSVVAGTVAASPVAPAVPNNAVALAQVYVTGGTAAIVAGNITDRRPGNLAIGAIPVTAPRGVLAASIATANSSSATVAGQNYAWITAPTLTFDGVRRVRITYGSTALQAGAIGDLGGLRLSEGAANIHYSQKRFTQTGGPGQESLQGIWQGVPAAGTRTYVLNVYIQQGTSVIAVGSAGFPAFLLIEDIGI